MYLSLQVDLIPEIRCTYHGYQLEKFVNSDTLTITDKKQTFNYKIGRCESRNFVELDALPYIITSNSIVFYSKQNQVWQQKFFNLSSANSYFLANRNIVPVYNLMFLGLHQETFIFINNGQWKQTRTKELEGQIKEPDGFILLTVKDIDDGDLQNEIKCQSIFKFNSCVTFKWDKNLSYNIFNGYEETCYSQFNFNVSACYVGGDHADKMYVRLSISYEKMGFNG